MKAIGVILALLLIAAVTYHYGFAPAYKAQRFEAAKWNEGRQNCPDLNISPWMLGDLMTNHLSLGMTMEAVTNVLGYPEIATPMGSGVRIRGEFVEETVYVYRPGMHNGWLVRSTNPQVLYFGRDGLKEWTPRSGSVQAVRPVESEASRNLLPDQALHIGNRHFSSTPGHFDALLGPPDEIHTEHQLDYFLGKGSRLAWDDVFLELHFDRSNRLSRMASWEH